MYKNKEAKETMQNSDRQEAKAYFDKELFDVMYGLMTNNIEVFKKFNDDKDFQSRYGEFIFDMMNEKFRIDKQIIKNLSFNRNPWVNPPVMFSGKMYSPKDNAEKQVDLVPIGATILRRITFPVKK
jgi:hypothetical protein